MLDITPEERKELEELGTAHQRRRLNILKGLYDGWDEYWGYEGLLPELRKFLRGNKYMKEEWYPKKDWRLWTLERLLEVVDFWEELISAEASIEESFWWEEFLEEE